MRLTAVYITSKAESRSEYRRANVPMEQVRQTADASVEALHVAADFDAFEVIEGDAAEQALGRAATIEGWSLVSLGRVTRRPL